MFRSTWTTTTTRQRQRPHTCSPTLLFAQLLPAAYSFLVGWTCLWRRALAFFHRSIRTSGAGQPVQMIWPTLTHRARVRRERHRVYRGMERGSHAAHAVHEDGLSGSETSATAAGDALFR